MVEQWQFNRQRAGRQTDRQEAETIGHGKKRANLPELTVNVGCKFVMKDGKMIKQWPAVLRSCRQFAIDAGGTSKAAGAPGRNLETEERRTDRFNDRHVFDDLLMHHGLLISTSLLAEEHRELALQQ